MNESCINIDGADTDVAVSTRVRLARGVEGFAFGGRLSSADAERLIGLVSKPLLDKGGCELKPASALSAGEWRALIGKHLVSPEFASGKGVRALVLSEEQGLSLMINEEDHVRLQLFGAGRCVGRCLEQTQRTDVLISTGLAAQGAKYAFDARLGYLTHCATNLGTGLRVSVMLHLPVLEREGRLEALTAAAGRTGLVVRGCYGEGTAAEGSLYQISNRRTLGYTEEEIAQNLDETAQSLIAAEREARDGLKKREPERLKLEDEIWRAYGILTSARLLPVKEASALLSEYRLGLELGMLEGRLSDADALAAEARTAEATPSERAELVRRRILKENNR